MPLRHPLHLVARAGQELRAGVHASAQGEVVEPVASRGDRAIAGMRARIVDADRLHRMATERAAAADHHLEFVLQMEVRLDQRARILLDEKSLRRDPGLAWRSAPAV